MPTHAALTTTRTKDDAEALGAALERMTPEPTGVGVFEMEDGSGLWEVGAYFESQPDDIRLALLSAAHAARAFTVSEVPDIDWVAHVRRELSPVRAGRFLVYGSHDADRVSPDDVSLMIEASMAFGTGHHGTTQGCLLAFDSLLTSGFRPGAVADIGCGTAVLAMAAARVLPAAVVAAGDIDEVAVEVALANLRANGLDGRVTCVVAEGFGHAALTRSGGFDLVFANILKGPLVELAPAMAGNIVPGGKLILSGILNEQTAEIVSEYGKVGLVSGESFPVGDWNTLILTRG